MEQYQSTNIEVYIINIDENWVVVRLEAHRFGVTQIHWATLSNSDNLPPLRFITAGNDGLIKLWSSKENNFGSDINSISHDETLEGHSDVVRDIIWKYNNDAKYETIISGGDVICF
jgi:WD40 repeat protein